MVFADLGCGAMNLSNGKAEDGGRSMNLPWSRVGRWKVRMVHRATIVTGFSLKPGSAAWGENVDLGFVKERAEGLVGNRW